jgi:hypothetical protein
MRRLYLYTYRLHSTSLLLHYAIEQDLVAAKVIVPKGRFRIVTPTERQLYSFIPESLGELAWHLMLENLTKNCWPT